MKLIVIATFIAVCAAARLEHLERSYLPPDSILPAKTRISPGGFVPTFNVGSGYGQQQHLPQNPLPRASNRYLPPTKLSYNQESHFIGPVKGLHTQNNGGTPNQQYSMPSTAYGAPQGFDAGNNPGRSQSQFGTPNRQYLAPNVNSKQNFPFAMNAGASENKHQQFGSSSGSQYPQGSQHSQGSQYPQYKSATSRQYLVPKSSGSQFSHNQQFDGANAGRQQKLVAVPSRQYLSPQDNNFQQQQFGVAANRNFFSSRPSNAQRNLEGTSLNQQQVKFGPSLYFAPNNVEEKDQFVGSDSRLYHAPYASGSQKLGGSRYQPATKSEMFEEPTRQYNARPIDAFKTVHQQTFSERTGYHY